MLDRTITYNPDLDELRRTAPRNSVIMDRLIRRIRRAEKAVGRPFYAGYAINWPARHYVAVKVIQDDDLRAVVICPSGRMRWAGRIA